MKDELNLDKDSAILLERLRSLHHKIREHTKRKYNRSNPFNEDLFDWKEKGKFYGSKNTTIYDSATIMGNVEIGDNVWIGPFCFIDGTGGLNIGGFCDIAAGVKIYTHDTIRRCLSGGNHGIEYAPVSIGDCSFIGSDTVILKGVKIGKHCLVAANSLVNKSFHDNSIIAGIPAKKIGEVVIKGDKIHLNYYREK